MKINKKLLVVGFLKNLLFTAMFLMWYGGGLYWIFLEKAQRIEPFSMIILFVAIVTFMLQFTPGLPFTYHKLVCETYKSNA